ncbi:hypothetical protein JW930_02935 [Candidatus Woesearchaeota archaeon]|nr:hypothetical protein [Candidatus Woesearchaeota archaeon]
MRYHNFDKIKDVTKLISLKYLFIFAILLYLTFFNKKIFFLVVFEFADFIKGVVKVKTGYFPVDLVFVFGVTAAYFFSPYVSLIIILLGMVNRMIFGFFQVRQFTEILRHFIIFFVTYALRNYAFFIVGISMLALKYLLKIIGVLITRDTSTLEKLHFYFVNVLCSSVLFYLISFFTFYLG